MQVSNGICPLGIENGSLAKKLHAANDELDAGINENVDSLVISNDEINEQPPNEDNSDIDPKILDVAPDNELEAHPKNNEFEPKQLIDKVSLEVENRVKLFWRNNNKFYNWTIIRHYSRIGDHTALYDDGDTEFLNMDKEQYEVIENENAEEAFHDANDADNYLIYANNVEITPTVGLESEIEPFVKSYQGHFGFIKFTLFQEQGLPGFVLHNANTEQTKSYVYYVRKVESRNELKMNQFRTAYGQFSWLGVIAYNFALLLLFNFSKYSQRQQCTIW